jgi:hypothetical protein
MIVSAAPLPVLPEPAVFFETIDRRWIRITLVEFANLPGYVA